MHQNEPVGQVLCFAGPSDFAATRRSPGCGEYAIYGNRGVPEFRMRARVECLRTRAERVRRSVHNLMQAYWHSLPRASYACARQFGCWRTPLALRPAQHPLRGRRTDLRILAAHPRHTAQSVRQLRRRTNRYVDARTPPATAQPGRPLRRRPSRYVGTMRTGRGFYYVRRAAHSGQLPFIDCNAPQCSC